MHYDTFHRDYHPMVDCALRLVQSRSPARGRSWISSGLSTTMGRETQGRKPAASCSFNLTLHAAANLSLPVLLGLAYRVRSLPSLRSLKNRIRYTHHLNFGPAQCRPHCLYQRLAQGACRRLFPLKVSKDIETVDQYTAGPQRGVFVRHFPTHLLPAGVVLNVTIYST